MEKTIIEFVLKLISFLKGKVKYHFNKKIFIFYIKDIPCPVDSNGFFTEEVKDFVGRYVKDADKDIIKLLKENKRLIQNSKIKHSYPFCWRYFNEMFFKIIF